MNKDRTAYCGIYCPDCIHFKNDYSKLAKKLEDHLKDIEFDKYAEIDSPFGKGFKNWKKFSEVLATLANTKCNIPCRPGGGCSGVPCKIMNCCLEKNYEGCWECSDYEGCEKFDFLEPRCGQMPKSNIHEIKKNGMDCWPGRRHKFYIWQK
ncbi:DUF3795 domain-containing protein [Maridesulfovibrio zosterae]|uniref:DUF3795 domain-containing protein n=1 Tax=Maridesulfovibrio zosterae TaxID=82171 RepID=UPI0003FD9BC6|nr:DUF3795 domain-containing protein [Maridesulfovibrio zosterae]